MASSYACMPVCMLQRRAPSARLPLSQKPKAASSRSAGARSGGNETSARSKRAPCGAEKKNNLEAEVELCSVKLDRAQKLIGGLGGERDRWSATAEDLEAAYAALTGDALLAAATMSYFGAFTAKFRQHSIEAISHIVRTPPRSSCARACCTATSRFRMRRRCPMST